MYFLIDGYNLLFNWIESKESIEKQRVGLIKWVQAEFERFNLQGIIVFDGAHRREEESGLSYPSPMTVAYTPKGQSADEYIVEKLENSKILKTCVVVTNDKGLIRHATCLGSKIMSNHSFINWLLKKGQKKSKKKISVKDCPREIERLSKIFEERLKSSSSDDLKGWE